jgi:hypothetical protein
MVSTLQSYIYDDLHPKIEKQDTPESQLLIVHIPDGLFGLTILSYLFMFLSLFIFLVDKLYS